MNHPVSKLRWLLLIAALPTAGCLLVQPLDSATPDEDDSSAAGSSSSHAGAKGSAGKSSGSSGAPGSAGRPGSGTGGATTTPPTGNARFVGDWSATSGMLTFSCPGVADMSQDVTGYAETWEVGTTSALLQQNFEGTCPLNANVSGTTASAVPGQHCTETNTDATSGDSITQTLAFTTYRFVIDAAGDTATETFAGTDIYKDNTTNQSLTCTFSRNAVFAKDASAL